MNNCIATKAVSFRDLLMKNEGFYSELALLLAFLSASRIGIIIPTKPVIIPIIKRIAQRVLFG